MDFVDPAVIWGTRFNIRIKFFGADDQECIVDMGRHAVVRIADVAGGSVGFGVQDPIDEDAHDAVQVAGYGDVVPHAVSDVGYAAQGFRFGPVVDPKRDSPISEREAKFAGVQVFKDAAIEYGIAIDPVFPTRGATAGVVFARVGFHPPFEGEIGGTDIYRSSWIVNRDFNPVDIVHSVAIETKRVILHGVVEMVVVDHRTPRVEDHPIAFDIPTVIGFFPHMDRPAGRFNPLQADVSAVVLEGPMDVGAAGPSASADLTGDRPDAGILVD